MSEVRKIPVEVEVPVYKKVEKPDYVLVREEITYQVPRVQYEDKTYERPVYKNKEYIVPVYKEVEYEIPVIREVEYERPVYKEKEYEIPKIIYRDDIRSDIKIVEEKVIVKVPHYVCESCGKEVAVHA